MSSVSIDWVYSPRLDVPHIFPTTPSLQTLCIIHSVGVGTVLVRDDDLVEVISNIRYNYGKSLLEIFVDGEIYDER